MPTAPVLFDAEVADELLHAACDEAGMSDTGAELVRLGENAIYRLRGGVVARVGRSTGNMPEARREVELARWLHQRGVPTAPPADFDQPFEVGGHPVTFWTEIPSPLKRGSVADMARVLCQVHELDPPAFLGLQDLVPFQRIADRLAAAPIDEASRQTLQGVLAVLEAEWAATPIAAERHLLHGDAHTSNLIRGSDGRLALIDLETCCIGPREWDLALTATYATSLGWVSAGEYRGFVEAYGIDVTDSPAWPLLRRVRELRMTAWLAQKAGESAETAAEVRHRAECLINDNLPRRWSRN